MRRRRSACSWRYAFGLFAVVSACSSFGTSADNPASPPGTADASGADATGDGPQLVDGGAEPQNLPEVVGQPGFVMPYYLRADNDALYLTCEDDQSFRIDKQTGVAKLLAFEGTGPIAPVGLALSDGEVFIAASNGVFRVAKLPEAVGTRAYASPASDVTFDPETNALFSCYKDLQDANASADIAHFPLSAVPVLPNNPAIDVIGCESLAKAAGDLYFGGRSLSRVTPGSSNLPTLMAAAATRRLVVGPTHIYSTQFGEAAISRTDRKTKEVQHIAVPDAVFAGDLVLDGNELYVANGRDEGGGGAIYRIDLASKAVAVIAKGLADPRGIAVDQEWVYWAEHAGGRVQKIRRR